MKIVIKKNNTTLLHGVFMLWLFCEIMFEHTVISQAALMVFVGVTILVTRRLRWSMLLTGYCLFALWSVLNIFLGHAQSVAVSGKMTRTLFLNIAFLYAFVCYCRYTKDYPMILKIYRWIALLFSIPCLIGGLGSVFQGHRLSILGINQNRIAMTMAYAIIIMVHELLQKEKRMRRTWDYAVLLLLVVTIVLTGSRKGLLIPIIGVYLLICARKPKNFIKYSLIALALISVLLYLLINIEPLYTVLGYRVEAVLKLLQGEEFNEGSLATRNGFITLGWELAQQKPFWGHGLDCFRLLRKSFGTYSHNNYVEILYSLGWVGLVFYYLPYATCLHRLVRGWKKNSILVALFVPYVICEYMNVSYFERLYLLIPTIVIVATGEKGKIYENRKVD